MEPGLPHWPAVGFCLPTSTLVLGLPSSFIISTLVFFFNSTLIFFWEPFLHDSQPMRFRWLLLGWTRTWLTSKFKHRDSFLPQVTWNSSVIELIGDVTNSTS